MFRLFECCALSFFERFVLSFSLKIERFVSDSAEIWICGLYMQVLQMLDLNDRSMITGKELLNNVIDYDEVHKIIGFRREQSLGVLIDELKGLENDRENKKNS